MLKAVSFITYINFNIDVNIRGFLGLRMVTGDTFVSLAPASLVLEVRGHHYEVGLVMLIIFMYNMSILEGSWGSGW